MFDKLKDLFDSGDDEPKEETRKPRSRSSIREERAAITPKQKTRKNSGTDTIGINVGRFEENPKIIDLNNIANSPFLELGDGNNKVGDVFSTIRFMNWQNINNSGVCELGHLPDEDTMRNWEGGNWYKENNEPAFAGVPAKVCAEIANAANAAAWVCIPHQANTMMMQKIIDDVASVADYPPIFEFSNEVWNGSFRQLHFCKEKAEHSPRIAKEGIDGSKIYAAFGYQAYQTIRIAEYVRNQNIDAKVVVSGQANNVGVLKQLLNYPELAEAVDAITIAPYYGQKINLHNPPESWGDPMFPHGFDPLQELVVNPQKKAGKRMRLSKSRKGVDNSVKQLHDNISAYIEYKIRPAIREHKQLAEAHSTRTHKIGLWAYEAGQHLLEYGKTAESEAVRQLYFDFNTSQYAGDLMAQLLDVWHEEGGEIICPYRLTSLYQKWDKTPNGEFWGVIRDTDYVATPKFDALVKVSQKI